MDASYHPTKRPPTRRFHRASGEPTHSYAPMTPEHRDSEPADRFAAGIAHDVNNVLTLILGTAELALLDLDPTAPLYAQFEHIRRAAYQASDLSRQLLACDSSHRTLLPTELNGIAAEQADLLAGCLPPCVTLRRQLAPHLPAIAADATQLRRIVLNLLRNAAEALDTTAGTITICTHTVHAERDDLATLDIGTELPTGTYVAFTVADTGPGMDPPTCAHMFERLFTTKADGHGLGLSVVAASVQLHGGGIKVHSAPGQGTTFTVLFPVYQRNTCVQ